MRTAAERGYAKTTVNEVAAAAGVPSDAFYEHFSGKDQCLSAAYDAFVDRMFEEAEQASGSAENGRSQVKEAVGAALSLRRRNRHPGPLLRGRGAGRWAR